MRWEPLEVAEQTRLWLLDKRLVVRVESRMPVSLLQSVWAEIRVDVVDVVRNGGSQGRV